MESNAVPYVWRIVLVAAAAAWSGSAFAQQHPERHDIRSGNRSYESQDYVGSEERYRSALEKNPQSFEAAFNLADALYRQERYDEAVQILNTLAKGTELSPARKAKLYYNLGNIMFSTQKLKEAEDFYKQSLRENPADMEAKYNLAYVQKLLEEQNQDQNQNQNPDQNQSGDRNQDGNDDNPNRENESDSPDDRNDGGEGQEEDQNPENGDSGDNSGSDGSDDRQPAGDKPTPQPGESGMNREDAESILDALQQQEDKTRDKVNAQKAVTVGRSGKNW